MSVSGHLRSPLVWLAALGLVPGIAFSVMAWVGSVMMLIPLAVYVWLRVVMDVRGGVSPGMGNIPLAVGMTIGAIVIVFLHFRWEWHDGYVAYIALIVAGGTVGVLAIGEVWRYLDVHPGGLLAIQVIGFLAGIVGFRQWFSEEWEGVWDRGGDVFARDTTAIESTSFFAQEYGYFFGPIMQIGVDVLLAGVVLAWGGLGRLARLSPRVADLRRVRGDLVRVRDCAGALCCPAVDRPGGAGGGLGLVYLLSWVDLVRRPKPFRESVEEEVGSRSVEVPGSLHAGVYLVAMIVLLGGVSLAFVPMLGAEVTYTDAEFEAMQAIDAHAAEYGELEPYVLSNWGGNNRMFNHLVFGEGNTYGYAQQHYASFILADDPDAAYDEYASNVGYVVIHELDDEVSGETAYGALHDDVDPDGNTLPDSGHFQALYLDDEVSVYALVPGATIEVNDSDVSMVETDVNIGGQSFAYERSIAGSDNVTVAYSGTYEVNGETETVNESAILNGKTISVP